MGARETWQRLRANGWAQVRAWVQDREAESVHLDFKARTDPSAARLNEKELGQVAKAASAFANVEGGVLLIGVTTERQRGVDRAGGVEPFVAADAVAADLDGRIASLTDPPVPGADVLPIVDATQGAGIVAVYVPQSDGGPHRAMQGPGDVRDRYYMRTGTNSAVMPHAILAGMFGRRPLPHFKIGLQRADFRTVTVWVANEGRGSASHVLVRTDIEPLDAPRGSGSMQLATHWERYYPSMYAGQPEPPMVAARLPSDLMLYSQDRLRVFSLDLPNATRFRVRAQVDARDAPPARIDEELELEPWADKPGHPRWVG